MLGLVLGDVAIWRLQTVQQGRFLASANDFGRTDAEVFVVPGADHAVAQLNGDTFPRLVKGWSFGATKEFSSDLPVESKLSPFVRYLDLVGKMALRNRLLGPRPTFRFKGEHRSYEGLQILQGLAPVASGPLLREKREWFRTRFIPSYIPLDEEDRLNQYALRLQWGETGLKAEYLSLYHRLGSSALILSDPVQDDFDHLLWMAADKNEDVAGAAFEAFTNSKTQDPRVLLLAKSRLGDAQVLTFRILQYVHALTQDPAVLPPGAYERCDEQVVVAKRHLDKLLSVAWRWLCG
jgi:hypothetical protein